MKKLLSPSGVTPRGGLNRCIKKLNKDLYVVANFYPMRYHSIWILFIVGNLNKISNNKQ